MSGISSIPNPYTLQLAGVNPPVPIDSESTIHTPDTMKTDSTIHSPDTIKTDSTIHTPDTIKTDSTIHIPDTIKTDSKSEIDLKPVAVDSCTTIKLAPLPPSHIEQPYSQHFGFTFMGVELFGFNTSGRYETLLNTPPAATHGKRHEHRDRSAPPTVVGRPHGISVRVIDD
jgi:hypothetical protein